MFKQNPRSEERHPQFGELHGTCQCDEVGPERLQVDFAVRKSCQIVLSKNMSKTSYHRIIQTKNITTYRISRWCGFIYIIFLFLWKMCFLLCIFFNFPIGQILTPKIANGEITRFSRRRANAIPRPHDVMIVPVVLMQCSSNLGPVHFFRAAGGVPKRVRPKMAAFCCIYFYGGSESYYASCNFRVVICDYKDHKSWINHSTSWYFTVHGSCQGSMLPQVRLAWFDHVKYGGWTLPSLGSNPPKKHEFDGAELGTFSARPSGLM